MEGWPEHGCAGCSFLADQVAPPRAPERARHHAGVRLARAAGRHRALEGADGLGHALVHDHRRLRRGLRRRRVARHQRLHPRGRPDLPDLLHRRPRRRAMGSTWSYLDITALGRQEEWEDSPEGYPQTPPYQWWNLHDEYERRGVIAHVGRPAGGGAPPVGDRRRVSCWRAPGSWCACDAGGSPAHDEDTTLRMERTFDAPAQAVFDAWTSEEVMRRWWHAEHDWETTEAEVDLRIGGEVRVVMRDPHKDVEYGGGGALHGDRPAHPPGLHLDLGRQRHAPADRARLRGDRRRHHRPLHPQRPLGRGGGALARGRLGQGVRQPRAGTRLELRAWPSPRPRSSRPAGANCACRAPTA